MNRYHDAMERCAPPPELKARLKKAVLAAEPAQRDRPAVFRPRGFFRKAVLAAVLIVALTVSAGAAVLVNWDAIFTGRFGPDAAETPMAEKAFQAVNITSVCDDVALTIREALVSEKTVYLILDYQLPDSVDRAAVVQAEQSDEDFIFPPEIGYYLTGDGSWEELKAADEAKWQGLDWTDYTSYGTYFQSGNALAAHRLSIHAGGSTGSTENQGYDPDTNTLTYLCRITAESASLDFTKQPLTLLTAPPRLQAGGQITALADHPALVTFRPEAVGQTLAGSYQEDGYTAQATVSPFAISVEVMEVSGALPYQTAGDLLRDTSLVYRDGTVQPAAELTIGLGGSSGLSQDSGRGSVSFTSQFRELLDVSQVSAVRVGDASIPLE